jgi:hypothetical protein
MSVLEFIVQQYSPTFTFDYYFTEIRTVLGLYRLGEPHFYREEYHTLDRITWIVHHLMELKTLSKEVIELPRGLGTEKVMARIIEAPEIVSVNPDGTFELDFKRLEREDAYYLFSLEGDDFLAKKDRNTITVYEAYKIKDKLLAIPMYEVSLT